MKRLLPLLLLPLAASAATTPRGLVVDSLTIDPPADWNEGALLVRAEVRNPTATEQSVRIRFGNEGSSSSWSYGLETAYADLKVPAGGRSLCELPLPRAHHPGVDALYAIDGSGKATTVSSRLPTYEGARPWGHESQLYVSRSLSGEGLRDRLADAIGPLTKAGTIRTAGGYYDDHFETHVARAGDFAEPWPGDWRAYSVFSGVFLAERDLPDIPAPAKAALRDYVAAGGSVFFVGADTIPAEFADAPLAALAVPGAGAAALPAGVDARRCGLGFLATLPASVAAPGSSDAIPPETAAFLLRHVLQSRAILRAPGNLVIELAPDGNRGDPVVRPPVGLFLLLLAAFAILAGPVSLWLLARKNRRIHILWVLPAVSAVFSAAIILSLVLREGVTPTVELRTGVLLDQRAGRAVAFSRASFYSPLTLGSVDLPADAAVEPDDRQGVSGDVRVGGTARYTGWISPRTPASFRLVSVRATHLRLDIREDPATGAVEAVNAFGAPIERLCLFDDAGVLRTAIDLAPGASASLAPVGGGTKEDLALFAPEFAGGTSSLLSALGGHDGALDADPLCTPGLTTRRLYVAVLSGDESPFEPDPLPGRSAKRGSRTIVYGVY